MYDCHVCTNLIWGALWGALGAQIVRPSKKTVLGSSARAHQLPWGATGAHAHFTIEQIETHNV